MFAKSMVAEAFRTWAGALVFGLAVVSGAQGQWADVLKGTPLSRFSDDDMALFQDAQQTALETRLDGSVVAWNNPDTGSSGSVTPVKTESRNGSECRLLHIVNRAGDLKGESQVWLCKQMDGTWKVP